MSSTESDTFAVRRGRRLRLHWLSWVVLVIISAVMVLVVVPGSVSHSTEWEHGQLPSLSTDEAPSWTPYGYIDVLTSSHGWPFEFLRRPYSPKQWLIELDSGPVEWSQINAWSFSGQIYAFNPLGLLADASTGIAIVAAAVIACEGWRRRRNGFQFSLLDTAVLVTAVATILGWWQYHVRIQAAEHTITTMMTARGSLRDPSKGGPIRAYAINDYCGPDWLQRLLGNPYFIPFCHHIDRLELDSRLLSTEDYAAIRKLRFVNTVHCEGKLKSELVDALATLPNLRMLDGYLFVIGGGPLTPEPMVTSSEAPYLARLALLTTLNLGYSDVHPADIKHIARLPRLETLYLDSGDILIEDLEPLATCPTLKTVCADIVATDEERHAFDVAHPYLTVHWIRSYVPEPSDAATVQLSATDPWDVADVLVRRWQAEDSPDTKNGPATIDHEQLDISEIRLTQERVRRLPLKSLPDVTRVIVGSADSTKTAMDILSRCGTIDYVDVRHVPLTSGDLETISFQKEAQIFLQQGPLTAQEICEFARRVRPSMLMIFAAKLTRKEAQQVYDALPDGMTGFFEGLNDEQGEILGENVEYASPTSPFE
jgi:hypothetical protein